MRNLTYLQILRHLVDNADILRGGGTKSGLDKYASATDIYYEDWINMQVHLMSSLARHACFAS